MALLDEEEVEVVVVVVVAVLMEPGFDAGTGKLCWVECGVVVTCMICGISFRFRVWVCAEFRN